jgi:hypothetical protein
MRIISKSGEFECTRDRRKSSDSSSRSDLLTKYASGSTSMRGHIHLHHPCLLCPLRNRKCSIRGSGPSKIEDVDIERKA